MLRAYLRKEPRAIVIVSYAFDESDGYALVLGAHSQRGKEADDGDRAAIEIVSTQELDIGSLQKLHNNVFGCIGLINVGADLFVGLVTGASVVGDIAPSRTAMRVTAVAFHCLNKMLWDDNPVISYGGPLDPQGPVALPHEAGYVPPNGAGNGSIVEHPCASIKRLLGNGTFYFAREASFDLSRSLLQQTVRESKGASDEKLISPEIENPPTVHAAGLEGDEAVDDRFVWNTYLMEPLTDYRSRLEAEDMRLFDNNHFLSHLIHGYVGSTQVGPATLAVVSRLSWKRAGTRYATRGIDDDGNVANFAESETLFTSDGITFSFLQVRGSVPLFWEQQGLQAFNARIQITRSRLASQPAFDRHFVDLLQHYGHVHALNLLGQRDAEVVLTNAYAEHMRNTEAAELFVSSLSKERSAEMTHAAETDLLGLTNFDFHNVARLNGGLDAVTSDLKRLGAIRAKRDAFRYTLVDDAGVSLQRQAGVFRVNCLDCLDRTNVVQGVLSQEALQMCITQRSMRDLGAALWSQHRTLWAENGDALSRIYAGTGALNSDFTRTGVGKKTLGSFLSDAAKSASRLYINNFQDKSKQNVIDALLGNMAEQRAVSVYDPVHDALTAELNVRLDEYSTKKQVSVLTITWNLAGRGPGAESLAPLLFPTETEPDVYAIGLQEVVPLTPQQILLTDPEQLRYWERMINDTFARRRSDKQAQYVPLRSEQLVGTALLLYVKETLLPHVRQVEACTKKTGLKGMSGNKGGVAIRLNVYDTSFCFVTAHFAAGQSNVEERNADYWTLSRSLAFRGGRNVNNSHHAVWLGDFNYRIEGGNEIVRPLCERNDLDELATRDQLGKARQETRVFPGYAEGMLTFLPTYKYDFNSRAYDTGEKSRVPAWTDRILYTSRHPFASQQVIYSRAELLTSDHRPVFALFESDARQFDAEKRNDLRRRLLQKYKSSRSTVASPDRSRKPAAASGFVLRTESPDEFADGYETDELPAPSSDNGPCWWDEPLSSSEEESDTTQSKRQNGANSNPFARRRSGVQYAAARRTAPTTNGQQSSLSTGTSTRSFAPSPLASSVVTTPSSIQRSPDSAQQGRRSAPPPPASRGTASSRQKKSAAEEGDQTVTSAVRSKTAPPVPLKPVRLGERQKSTTDDNNINTSSAAPMQPPKVPMRPTLGTRSQSYQSIKSQRSLLDDSD